MIWIVTFGSSLNSTMAACCFCMSSELPTTLVSAASSMTQVSSMPSSLIRFCLLIRTSTACSMNSSVVSFATFADRISSWAYSGVWRRPLTTPWHHHFASLAPDSMAR